jgi:hypothetical protein
MEIVITTNGIVRCIYSDELDLQNIGNLSICRASHVEPTECGQWTADLSPSGGPLLGPFKRRSEALAAETAWLEIHWLPLVS